MKYQPIHEHMDGRGVSVRYAYQRDKRRRERKNAAKIMGKSYFTNPNESIESNHEHKHDDRRHRVFDFQANDSRPYRP